MVAHKDSDAEPEPREDETIDFTLGETSPGGPPTPPTPEEASPQRIPEQVGPYRVERELGRGGMGVVYVAEDSRLQRQVALKVLPDRISKNAEALARFETEARLLAAINHPNIATIHSLEEIEGLRFLTLELIPGVTFEEEICEGISLDRALTLCQQAAGALQAAHKQGVVHQDLKPANIMVTPEGQVKILDFGLAKAVRRGPPSDTPAAINTGSISGTPGYMSPEQLEGQEVDERADIWAFGCLLYECVTGQKAFGGTTVAECIHNTFEAEPDWDALPDTPRRVREVLRRCLDKDSASRLATIAEARRFLEEEIAARAVAATGIPQAQEPQKAPHNLPRQLTTFVGRDEKLREIEGFLEKHPLVTLTGIGGSGKTRLSIELATRVLANFPHGAWLVGLAPITDPDRVPRTVAQALGLKEEPNRAVTETLVEHLRHKTLLLLLDGCEHLLSACAELVMDLLAASPGLRVLASSREGLGIAGEALCQVPSLALPTKKGELPLDELERCEAVRLFIERAQSARAGFTLTHENAPHVCEICRRLDGIPLALELAAARTKVLAPAEIAHRLADRFRLLTGGSKAALARHQTLRAAIDWSYDHLSEEEQALFRRLSVFAGGWALDAAEAVCAGDGIEEWDVLLYLSNLVDKSLVEVKTISGEEDETVRYRFLESVREYAFDRLEDDGHDGDVRRNHRHHYLALAESVQPKLEGPEQAKGFALLELEHDNLRTALQGYLVEESEAESGLRLASALGLFWVIRGYWGEGREWLHDVLAAPGAQGQTAARAVALRWEGNLAGSQGDYARARALLEESLAILEKDGDQTGIATALNDLGIAAKDHGDLKTAGSLYNRSLEIRRLLNDEAGVAASLYNLGQLALLENDNGTAGRFYEESLGILRRLGDQHKIAVGLNARGNVAFNEKQYGTARSLYQEALIINQEIGNRRAERSNLNNLGLVASSQQDYPTALSFYQQSLTIKRELGDKFGVAVTLGHMAQVAFQQGDYPAARGLSAERLELLRDLGDDRWIADSLDGFARIFSLQGDARKAALLLGAAAGLSQDAETALHPRLRDEHGTWIQAVADALGTDEFEARCDEGRRLSSDEACEIALQG